jgi:hypothetical protein
LESLDGIVWKVYGCTFVEFRSKIFRCGHDNGLRKGRGLGRRDAKGMKGEPNKRGRPLKIDQSTRTLLTIHVDKAREDGKLVNQAISEFLEIMRFGAREAQRDQSTPFLPSVMQASRAYYRDRGLNKKRPQ